MLIEILFLAFFICCSAFFSAVETAFTSLSLMQVQSLSHKKGARGKLIQKLSNKLDTLITTILIGNNIVNIGASALATELTIRLFGSAAVGITTGIMTLVILIFGEVTPKRIAIAHNEFICLHSVRVISVLCIVFRPIVFLVSFVSLLFTKIFGSGKKKNITLEGILQMVKLAENIGVVEKYENQMVKNVFRMGDVTVQSIMTHRTRIFSLPKDLTLGEAVPRINEEGYSRIPVYDENPEDIVGIVLAKDVMKHVSEGDVAIKLKELMVKPLFVPGTKKVNLMFSQFKKEKLKLAVVLDEYGGLAGIVSLEDVIEEILGEIYDEDEDRGREKIVNLGKGLYRIEGDAPVHLVNETLKLNLPFSNKISTFGGCVIAFLGRFPHQNETLDLPFGSLRIESVANRQIGSVLFQKPLEPQELPPIN